MELEKNKAKQPNKNKNSELAALRRLGWVDLSLRPVWSTELVQGKQGYTEKPCLKTNSPKINIQFDSLKNPNGTTPQRHNSQVSL